MKSDHCVHKILKKLEKYGKNPDLKIEPDAFLKALADLQVWELCSPEIAAAVEVRWTQSVTLCVMRLGRAGVYG